MRKQIFIIVTIIIIEGLISTAFADQETSDKTKKLTDLRLQAIELELCQSTIAAIINRHTLLKEKINELEKCYLDKMDSEHKTVECRRLILGIIEQVSDLISASIPSCLIGSFDPLVFIKDLADQKNKLIELSSFVLKNYKVLTIKEINQRLNATLPELLKHVDRMNCDIEITHNGALITKYGIALIKAKMNGDYHTMKQVVLKILSLKVRLDLAVKKCNVDKNDPYIIGLYKRITDDGKLFEKVDVNHLLKVACKNAIKLNPSLEIVRLCEQGVGSDYFFSSLSDLLNNHH